MIRTQTSVLIKLNIPLIRQPKESSDCGIACVAMILEYYKVPYDYAALRKEIGVLRWGTSAPQLGGWLLKHGFDVEIVSMHPSLFKIDSQFKTKKMLLKHLRSFRGAMKTRLNQIVLEHFIAFVQAGGSIHPHIPNTEDIKRQLAAKRPLICLLTPWFLHKNTMRPRFSFHFNVISGIDGKNIYVNDPDWGTKLGGRLKHEIKSYLYAIYASAFGAIDNASFIKIKYKGKM